MENNFCKQGQPILSNAKVAEIYYERGDLIDGKDIMIHRVNNGNFMFSVKEDYINGKVLANARPCVFYDLEKEECKLGDLKPSMCNGKKEVQPLLLNTLLEIKDLDKKELKKRMKGFKEDLILYATLWYLNTLIDEFEDKTNIGDIFELSYNYTLVKTSNNKITSLRYTKLKAKHYIYKPVASVYNTISKQMVLAPYDYLVMLVTKLNQLLKGVNQKVCDIPNIDIVSKYSTALMYMFRKYVDGYNNKSRPYTNISKDIDTFEFMKEMNKIVTGKEVDFTLSGLECITHNVDQLYTAIMKNK